MLNVVHLLLEKYCDKNIKLYKHFYYMNKIYFKFVTENL